MLSPNGQKANKLPPGRFDILVSNRHGTSKTPKKVGEL